MSENNEEQDQYFKSWGDFLGYDIGYEGSFTKSKKLELIANLENSDLIGLDPIELQIIIGQGKLPTSFNGLIYSESGSDERIVTLNELKEQLKGESDDDIEQDLEGLDEIENAEVDQEDDVDSTILTKTIKTVEPTLPRLNALDAFTFIDNTTYSGMDEEAIGSLIQYRLRLLWNKVLNNEISINELKVKEGGKYFTMIKNMFFEEYDIVSNYKVPNGYSFKYEPNLMQKLTVHRLIKNKSYGNWSGTGAGKTLSFIIASREMDAKLTVVIALNSTIKQTGLAIKEVYPDSKIFTEYLIGQKFDTTKNNYLVLNYEKFQQVKSENLYQDLTNNNRIDFIVVDEVHNAKQRDDKHESIRRGVLNRLLGRVRESNTDLNILAMSATPVINNIYEAKSLLTLLTGFEYNDIKERRTLSNATAMFQLLTLNGLRFIPKYEMNVDILTGTEMTNLDIDGMHLMDSLLSTKNYIKVEKLLLSDKLLSIEKYLRKGAIIYTYFTDGFIDEIKQFVEDLGFTTGTYTGEESTHIREVNLKKFQSGELDILIGSKPIGTGVDGLQEICDRMIIITLPWTHAELQQLIGRIYRQGSIFKNVEIIIPQVKINLDNGEFWSWDVERMNLINNKRTLADAVVDGIMPSKKMPTLETMHKKAIEALQNWKDRVLSGEIVISERKKAEIELYPEITDLEQRKRNMDSELSEFNRKGKTTYSATMHREFSENPESFFRYHALRAERMERWDEIPYEVIASKIKNKKHIVVDFGCGENKMKDKLPNNKVVSFDHVAFDDTVIACDMKDVKQYLSNESVDVTVFSLALWGLNYRDYLKEAYRTLNYGGFIYIAEPTKNYEGEEGKNELKSLILEAGFKLVGDIDDRGKFIYITGTKIN